MKLTRNPCFSSLFQQIYGDFVICFDMYIPLLLKMINGFSWPAKIMASPFNFMIRHAGSDQGSWSDTGFVKKRGRGSIDMAETKPKIAEFHELSVKRGGCSPLVPLDPPGGALPKNVWGVCAATLTPIFKPPVTEWLPFYFSHFALT